MDFIKLVFNCILDISPILFGITSLIFLIYSYFTMKKILIMVIKKVKTDIINSIFPLIITLVILLILGYLISIIPSETLIYIKDNFSNILYLLLSIIIGVIIYLDKIVLKKEDKIKNADNFLIISNNFVKGFLFVGLGALLQETLFKSIGNISIFIVSLFLVCILSIIMLAYVYIDKE